MIALRLAALLPAALAASGALAACGDPPAPGVDWQGCNLQSARLAGADLRGANLRDADLRDAGLARADLTGADLTGADLAHANLSGTIWTDGRVCAIGSDSSCD